MLTIAIALAHIMDPFILISIFSRLFSHAFMHSLVRADIEPQRFAKVIKVFVLTQIPLIVVAAVIVVKLNTATVSALDVNYIERKWFIVADFLLLILGGYTMMYLLRQRRISNTETDLTISHINILEKYFDYFSIAFLQMREFFSLSRIK